MNVTERQSFLVNSEVYTITGIKPKITVPSARETKPLVPIVLPPDGFKKVEDNVIDLLSQFEGYLQIIEKIVELISGEDGEGKSKS
jgi:hypothetical protein